MKFHIFLFFFICLLPIFGQELPPIKNYTPIDYEGENQNWAVAQSNSGHLYFANNSSLLEFDGEEWNTYPSPNGSVVRALAISKNVIYTGCYMEFGYWTRNRFGGLDYHSLTSTKEVPLLEDEQFWNIATIDDTILFQSLRRIYSYSLKDKSFKIHEVPASKAKIFEVNSGVYVQKKNEGIFKVTGGKLFLRSDSDEVAQKSLVGLFEEDGALFCVMEDANFYKIDANGKAKLWDIPASAQLESLSLYSATRLKNGNFILGTISDGIYHISSEGGFIQKINQRKGLNNNTVLNIFEDRESNLWLAHDNGISVLNLNSPFKEYIDKLGALGVVYTAERFNNYLYLGTNQGLFYKPLNAKTDFTLIKGTEGQVWNLINIDGTLFCGHNNGTFLVTEDRVEHISKLPGTWDLKKIGKNPNYLIQGNYNGLSILRKTAGKWEYVQKLEGFDISSRFFEFYDSDKLIVNNEYKGLFKLQLNTTFSALKLIESEPSRGYGSSLVRFFDDILYTTNNAVYKLDKENHDVVLDTTLTTLFFNAKEKLSSILIPDGNADRLWSFSDGSLRYLGLDKFGSKPTLKSILLPKFLSNRLGVSGFENVNNISKEAYLIGTSNGYVTLNLAKINAPTYRIDLTEVAKEYFDKPTEKVPLDSVMYFKNSENKLFFSYAVPQYHKYTDVKYQYKLDGFHDNWSSWSSIGHISLENLPFGEYSFRARAIVGGTLTENTISYNFEIGRPWYWSYLAIVLYVLGFILLSFLVHKRYKAYYKKQQDQIFTENKRKQKQKKVKTQKALMKLKNEKLKQEIEGKNR